MPDFNIDTEITTPYVALSSVSESFLEFAACNPECQRTVELRGHPQVPEFFRTYPFPMQSWPVFVSGPKLEELRTVPRALVRLFKSVPERFFGNNPQRIADFLGFEVELVRYMLEQPNGLEWAVARGDFIESADGLKCIEFNFSARLGGWQPEIVQGVWLKAPWMERFLDEVGYEARYRSPIMELYRHAARVSRERGLGSAGELNAAFIMPPEGVDGTQGEAEIRRQMIEHFARLYRRFLAEEGEGMEGALVGCMPADLEARPEGVIAHGLRIHVLFEYGYDLHRRDIHRLFRQGKVQDFNGPAYELINDKRLMALLSQWADSGLFDAEERRLLERHLPWTRLLEAEFTKYRGEREYLPDLLEEHRERLVLKGGDSFGGNAVVVGHRTDPDRWRALCDEALEEGSWIAQEWVQPSPMAFVVAGEPLPHDVIWGHFVFGDRYAGSFLRMMPQGRAGVVNSSQGAVEGLVFEVYPRRTPAASPARRTS